MFGADVLEQSIHHTIMQKLARDAPVPKRDSGKMKVKEDLKPRPFGDNSEESEDAIDLEYFDISNLKRKRNNKSKRDKTFPDQMSKAVEKLKKQNTRSQHFGPQKPDIEEQVFNVTQDPEDGNLYLHIEPSDLEKFSPEDLRKLSK